MSDYIETPSFNLAIYAKGDPDSKKVALVLPGRLDTKDYIHMTSHVNLLAVKGFYSVSIDPPFSWGSPGDISNYTTTSYLKALSELLDQFNKPALLVGHSRGGAVSMLASSNLNVTGLVLAMANYGNTTEPSPKDVRGDAAISLRDLPPGTSRTRQKKEFLLPLSYFEDSKDYRPAEQLAKFKGPKLIICGSRDEFISPEKVREVYDTLDAPKRFLELDTEHDYRLHADILEKVNEAIGQFVDEYFVKPA